MDSIQSLPFLGSVCRGCLSMDRQLSAIMDNHSLKIFCGFLDETNAVDQSLLLCWECVAIMRRITRFIYQVRIAHNSMVKYMLNQSTHMSPLSRLSRCNLDSGCLEIGFNDMLDSTDSKTETQNLLENKTQPLAFIKVEEEDNALDAEFQDDDICDEVEDADDRDDKPDLKSHDTIDHSNLKGKIKPKRNKKRKVKEEFNLSDDEPLKAIKDAGNREIESKVRKRRKKKDEEKVIKDAKRKREKPPGVVHNTRVTKMLQQLNVNSDQLEMVVLSWEEVEEERQKALVSETFTRHEYRCQDCVLGFNHRFKLDNHMKKHDPTSGSEVCDICRVRCKDAHALCAHRRRHRVRWRCVVCSAAWSRAGVAADHIAREHGAPPPTHVCSVCGHLATTLGKLRNHMKSHSERQKCELCNKTFQDRASLRTHLFIHNGEKEYECPRCGKRFLFKKAMQIHLVTHDASAHVYCYECDMNFKNQMSFNQHMKYSLKHIDPAKLKYACHLCDKKFLKAKRLEEHNLAVHLKATPIKCTVPGCNFACASRPVLRTHNRVRHRHVRAKRDHVCDVCGKAYTSFAGLRGHLRAHSGERPLRCKRCPAAFGYEAALYNHNRLVHQKPKTGRGRVVTPPLDATGAIATADSSIAIWAPNPLPAVDMTQQSDAT